MAKGKKNKAGNQSQKAADVAGAMSGLQDSIFDTTLASIDISGSPAPAGASGLGILDSMGNIFDHDTVIDSSEQGYDEDEGENVSESAYYYVPDGQSDALELQVSIDSGDDLSTKEPRLFGAGDADMIESSRAVRRQHLFPQWEAIGFLKKMAAEYPFVPFDYQYENVRIMLNRFEGKGVFGESVGLGKTVQALMTAHAMFVSGAIRSALIVVPAKTVGHWISEIKSKFPSPILHLCNHGIESLDTVMRRMRDDDAADKGGNRVYIVTEDQMKSNTRAFSRAAQDKEYTAVVDGELSESDTACLGMIENALMPRMEEEFGDIRDESRRPSRVLERHGWGRSSVKHFSLMRDPGKYESACLVSEVLTVPKYKRLIEIMERAVAHYREFDLNIPDDMREAAEKLADAQRVLARLKCECEARVESLKRIEKEGMPSKVDLLIVDEVHAFYEGAGDRIGKSRDDAVSLLAERIEKKYCVLMSATPVRNSLDDIFDLVYIVDPKRLRKDGESRDQARRRFYRDVCGIKNVHGQNKLFHMIYKNPETRRKFFGVVANFFTRDRIADAEADMRGEGAAFFRDLDEDAQTLLVTGRDRGARALELPFLPRGLFANEKASPWEQITSVREVMFRQEGQTERAATLAKEYVSYWYGGERPGSFREERHLQTKNAVDAVMIGCAENTALSNDVRRRAHRLVDWHRREKEGIAIALTDGETIPCTSEGMQKILKQVSDGLSAARSGTGSRAGIARRMITHFHNDAMLIYVSRNSGDGEHSEHGIREHLKELLAAEIPAGDPDRDLKISFRGRSVKVGIEEAQADADGQAAGGEERTETEITANNHNQVAIVSQGFQAGVNLQEYHVLIFLQMDWKGQRLLEPVDIEQWIGRIHRTGQVKTSHIITALTTFITREENAPDRNPGPDFLQWYYEILSDEAGLDLYGNTTPDIAFLQPVIVDALRACFTWSEEKLNRYFLGQILQEHGVRPGPTKQLEEARKRMKLPTENRRNKPWSYNFGELMELCFRADEVARENHWKPFVKAMIRDLCNQEQFGKRMR